MFEGWFDPWAEDDPLEPSTPPDPGLVEALDAANTAVGRAQRELLSLVVRLDRSGAFGADGARSAAHWLWMRYGISGWKAHRWVAAAHALEELPGLSEALSEGALGIDKIVELARFATPQTEADLIGWAKRVSVGAVRHRGDLSARASREEVAEAHRERHLSWWYLDDRFGLEAELPAAEGAVVARALERVARGVPAMPGEEGSHYAEARRADALVALCSAGLASDPDPDRATVVIHAQAAGLASGTGGCEVEGGPVIHPETVRRLLCTSRSQVVVQDRTGQVTGLTPTRREPPAWMVRQIRHRDRGCTFPGCGTRAFTEAHHIRWWRHGGRTELSNLALVCGFHHRLVHEHGWRMARGPDGVLGWFRPDGTRYRAGPSPPSTGVIEGTDPGAGEQPVLEAVG